MKKREKKPDAELIWKQITDLVIPRLGLNIFERAVYWHVLRHSRLEGERRLRFSIKWMAQSANITEWMVRKTVRQLVARGVVRLLERSKRGHMIEVRLPEEIPGVRAARKAKQRAAHTAGKSGDDLEETDFLETRGLREAIYAREKGRCFYCMRRATTTVRCIDHVIPQVRGGGNSYRNLVTSCGECNSQKGEQEAKKLLRWLYREGRLTGGELTERIAALEMLAAGKLRPKPGASEQEKKIRAGVLR
ncbi:MAG TPA: HNH endonuclease [Candidatus Acidoferrum sp.]|nr:HNH endonuclease [Candidatus Acidoferrum sp.]